MEPPGSSSRPTGFPLTDSGLAQVHKVSIRLSVLPIDSIFSSPLGRAAATATIFGEVLGLEIHFLDDLSEIDQGSWTGLTSEEVDHAWPGERDRRWKDLYRWRFPEGESYADADARARCALDRVEQAGVDRPLIVSHEMIGRMPLKNLLALPIEDSLLTTQPHTVVRRVDPGMGRFTDLLPE